MDLTFDDVVIGSDFMSFSCDIAIVSWDVIKMGLDNDNNILATSTTSSVVLRLFSLQYVFAEQQVVKIKKMP